jgi:hypothetical protein
MTIPFSCEIDPRDNFLSARADLFCQFKYLLPANFLKGLFDSKLETAFVVRTVTSGPGSVWSTWADERYND